MQPFGHSLYESIRARYHHRRVLMLQLIRANYFNCTSFIREKILAMKLIKSSFTFRNEIRLPKLQGNKVKPISRLLTDSCRDAVLFSITISIMIDSLDLHYIIDGFISDC